MIFLRGCANSQSGCVNIFFCIIFAENCMEMKEFGLGGGEGGAPLRSATVDSSDISVNFVIQFWRDYQLCMAHISILI